MEALQGYRDQQIAFRPWMWEPVREEEEVEEDDGEVDDDIDGEKVRASDE